jgi:hypothetical protein
MADIITSPQLGPGGEPVTSTTTQLTPSSRSDFSQKLMSPEARQQLRSWLDALDEQANAAQGGPPVAQKTAEDVDAEIRSQEQSQLALDRAEVAAQPDPFSPPTAAPSAPPVTVGGKPLMVPPEMRGPAPGPVDRPYTSQEFNATPEIRGPQTVEAAKDEAAVYEAQVRVRLAKERAEQMASLQAEQDRRRAEAVERINATAARYERLADKLFEEPSTLRKIMGAVAMGLGAYGAGLTGGPNYALEILKQKQQREMESKRMLLGQAQKQLEAAGASMQQVDAWAKEQQERLLALQKAQTDAVDANVSRMLSPFPNAQRAWAEKSAALKAENAAKIANFVQDATARTQGGGRSTEGVKQTTTEKSASQSRGVTESEATRAMYGARMKMAVDTIKANPKLSGEDFEKLFLNTLSIKNQAENSTKGLFGVEKIKAMRALTFATEALTDGIPEEKKASAIAWAEGTCIIIRDESGAAINIDENINNAQKFIPQKGEGDKTYNFKLEAVEKRADLMLRMAGPEAYRRATGKEMPGYERQARPQPTARAQPTKEERAALTLARQLLKFPDRVPPERLAKAKRAIANYEKKYGAR